MACVHLSCYLSPAASTETLAFRASIHVPQCMQSCVQVASAATSAGQMGNQLSTNIKAMGQSWWGGPKAATAPEDSSVPTAHESQPTAPVRMGGFGTNQGSPAPRYGPAGPCTALSLSTCWSRAGSLHALMMHAALCLSSDLLGNQRTARHPLHAAVLLHRHAYMHGHLEGVFRPGLALQ